MDKKRSLGAIILAAGRGSRMKAKNANKVTFLLADKPIILHAIHLLEKIHFALVVVVVGFAKESVMKIIDSNVVVFAEQQKRLGTAHAVKCGLEKIPESITDILVIQGDDSAFYKQKTITELVKTHISKQSALTFLTIDVNNPHGLGRVIRDNQGKVTAIIEEKDASDEQRLITEINPACYVFSVDFLRKYLKKVHKSPVTGEYYLTSLVDIALHNKEKVETVQAGFMPWRGVNTKEELREAEVLLGSLK